MDPGRELEAAGGNADCRILPLPGVMERLLRLIFDSPGVLLLLLLANGVALRDSVRTRPGTVWLAWALASGGDSTRVDWLAIKVRIPGVDEASGFDVSVYVDD